MVKTVFRGGAERLRGIWCQPFEPDLANTSGGSGLQDYLQALLLRWGACFYLL